MKVLDIATIMSGSQSQRATADLGLTTGVYIEDMAAELADAAAQGGHEYGPRMRSGCGEAAHQCGGGADGLRMV